MPKVKSADLPTNPDFSFIEGRGSSIISAAYEFMCKNPDYWDIIFKYQEISYVFTHNQNMVNLMNLINESCPYKTDRSGIKMSWIMRNLEFIIFNGFTKYKDFSIRGILSTLDY